MNTQRPQSIEQYLLLNERKIGISQGIDIKTRETIRNAYNSKKVSVDFIAKIVKLSPERVGEILVKMGLM